jgi:hypothetical protein
LSLGVLVLPVGFAFIAFALAMSCMRRNSYHSRPGK